MHDAPTCLVPPKFSYRLLALFFGEVCCNLMGCVLQEKLWLNLAHMVFAI